MSKNDAWMPLYIGDYLADTMHLTTAQHGAYLLLIMQYWKCGPLPDDDAQLATIAKLDAKSWRTTAKAIRAFFIPKGGQLTHKRIDKERQTTAELSKIRSGAGKAGAEARWGQNGSNPDGKPPGKSHGKRMANATERMANGWQTDGKATDFATTPLPSQKNRDSLEEGTSSRAPVREEPPPVSDPVGPEAAAKVVTSIVRADRMRAYPPGQFPAMTRNEQVEALTPQRPKPAYLTPEQLALTRRRAMG